MQRTSRVVGGAVGAIAALILVAVGFLLWQKRPVGLAVTPGPTQGDAVAITFACPPSQLQAYEKLAKAFHEDNPSIQVRIVASDDVFSYQQASLRSLVASADGIALGHRLTPPGVRSGLLRDLQPFLDADPTFDTADVYPGLLDVYRWQGSLWGLPAPGTPLLLFYDGAAFDEAGLPRPRPGWSLEDFEAAATALTQDQADGTMRYGLVLTPWSPSSALLIADRAGEEAARSDGMAVLGLDTPAMAEAMQWFVDLARVRGVMPDLLDVKAGPFAGIPEQVQEGRAALWDGRPAYSLMRIYRAAYDELGVVPFPGGTPAADSTGNLPYVMSAGTAHPDEVWRWLRFLTFQSGDVEGVRPPVRRSVAEATGYWDELDPVLSPAVRYVVEQDKAALPPGMLDSLSATLGTVLAEDEKADAALAPAQSELNEALEAPLGQATPPPVDTPKPQPAAGEGVTIEFAAADYWQLGNAYDRLAAEFHTLHPEIRVEPKSPNFATGRQTVTYEWLASQGDCFSYYFYPMDEPAILRLDPLLEADSTFPADDVYPHLLERFYQEGKLWALPREVSPRVMYYHKALFDRAGLPYPSPGWTLKDFAEAATRLTEGEGEEKQYGYSPSVFLLPSDPLFFIVQRGIPRPEDGADVSLDDPEILEAIRWYVGLWQTVMPEYEYEVSGQGEIDYEAQARNSLLWELLIRDGRVAMWSTQWSPYQSDSRAWENPDVGIAPMPQGPGRVVDMMSMGYYISAETAHPEACWKWLTFLSEQAAIVQGVPARRFVAESDAYRQQMGAETADVYLATLEGSEHVIDSNSIDWNTYEGRVVRAVMLVLQGESVEQAWNQVQE